VSNDDEVSVLPQAPRDAGYVSRIGPGDQNAPERFTRDHLRGSPGMAPLPDGRLRIRHQLFSGVEFGSHVSSLPTDIPVHASRSALRNQKELHQPCQGKYVGTVSFSGLAALAGRWICSNRRGRTTTGIVRVWWS
jgi:hypothetical protein